jgi:hypothetical protein
VVPKDRIELSTLRFSGGQKPIRASLYQFVFAVQDRVSWFFWIGPVRLGLGWKG